MVISEEEGFPSICAGEYFQCFTASTSRLAQRNGAADRFRRDDVSLVIHADVDGDAALGIGLLGHRGINRTRGRNQFRFLHDFRGMRAPEFPRALQGAAPVVDPCARQTFPAKPPSGAAVIAISTGAAEDPSGRLARFLAGLTGELILRLGTCGRRAAVRSGCFEVRRVCALPDVLGAGRSGRGGFRGSGSDGRKACAACCGVALLRVRRPAQPRAAGFIGGRGRRRLARRDRCRGRLAWRGPAMHQEISAAESPQAPVPLRPKSAACALGPRPAPATNSSPKMSWPSRRSHSRRTACGLEAETRPGIVESASFSTANSENGTAGLFEEIDFGVSNGLCSGRVPGLRADCRGEAAHFSCRADSPCGDIDTRPAISSNVGAPLEGSFCSFAVTLGRAGAAERRAARPVKEVSQRRPQDRKAPPGKPVRFGSVVDLPEIADRLDEFNFNIALDARKIPTSHHAAHYIPALLVRQNDLLPDRQGIRQAKHASIIENDDGTAFLPGRAGSPGCVAIFTGQTSNDDGNLKANRIGPGGLTLRIFGPLARTSRSWVFQSPRRSL